MSKKWYKKYSVIHHNAPSVVIRQDVVQKHKLILRDIEILLDFALFVLSINDGYYLHIPERLTTHRVGSGITTMSVWGIPARVRYRLCTLIRNGYDKYVLYNYIANSMLKK